MLSLLFLQSFCYAQSNVSGYVKDPSGTALQGVSVVEVGNETNGTLTNAEGAFSITLQKGTQVSFSFIGFQQQVVTVQNFDAPLNVTLKNVGNDLNEVVVVGYATQRKGNLTSAISTINAADLTRTTATTTSGALVGKVAGITYRQASGVPGSITNIQIRNMGQPAYVIDGVLSDGGTFNNLAISDIESISILKDGAAAIYGFKAADGAILVTTKSGKFNAKPTISVNTYYGWQQWFRYPRLLDAYEWNYANIMKEVNNGTYRGDPEADKLALEKWKAGVYDSVAGIDYRGYDWKKNFVNNAAPMFYRDFGVSGGSERVSYYLSFGAINQDAVFKDYKFKRYNTTARVDARVTNRLKLGVKLAGRVESRTNPGMPGADDYEAVRNSVFEIAPIYRPYANDNPLYPNAVPGEWGGYGNNLAAISIENSGLYDNKWYVMQSDWTGEYKTPIKGVSLKGLYSLNFTNNVLDNFEKGWREYSYDKNTQTYNVVYDKTATGNTYNVKARGTGLTQVTQFMINYDSVINRAHHITAVAGIESNKAEYKGLQVTQSPIETDLIPLIYTNKNNEISDAKSVYTRLSYIFRLGYDYKQKYLLNALARYDGTWRFPKENRWGFFPSVQVAWNIAKENFVVNSGLGNYLSNAKLRFSYGELGDERLPLYGDFSFLPGYNYNPSAYFMTPLPGSSVTGQPISGAGYRQEITTLTWMTSKFLNAGIDLGFFNNKLTMEFNAFQRTKSGIPVRTTDFVIPYETGLSANPKNLNSDQILGLDGAIMWTDNSKDFKYNIGVNATLARQKFGKQYGESFYNSWDQYRWSASDRWSNVSPQSQMWMWEVIGRFKTQEEIDNYPVNIDGQNNVTVRPGDLIFKDVNGDGLINSYDERPLGYAGASWPWDDSYGNRQPLLTAGLNLGFQYKSLDFAADFASAFMNTFVMDWFLKFGVQRNVNGYYFNSMDVWRHEDIFDPNSPWVEGTYPSLGTTSTRWWNTFYTHNVNYLRLRNVVLGYSLPKSITDRVRMQKARFYLQGTNLFSIDNLKKLGFDPEITRVDGKDYPQHRVVTFGIQVTL